MSTADDIDAVLDEATALLGNPMAFRVTALSMTFDHPGSHVTRRAAAAEISRGHKGWPTDTDFAEEQPIGPQLVDAIAAAYGVPSWFVSDTATDPISDVELDHELRIYRVNNLTLDRYGAHTCPTDPAVDDAPLLHAAHRALKRTILDLLGTGILLVAFFALILVIGVGAFLSNAWIGIPLFVLIVYAIVRNSVDWTREFRTVLTARNLPTPKFALFVQQQLHRHIGRTLGKLYTRSAAHSILQPALCHDAPIDYSALTTLAESPHALLQAALRNPAPRRP